MERKLKVCPMAEGEYPRREKLGRGFRLCCRRYGCSPLSGREVAGIPRP